jgi:hypothetical protein
MAGPTNYTLAGLDTATMAVRQSRRDELLRIAQNTEMRIRIAYGCTAIQAVCAIAAFLADGRRPAMIIGAQTCVVFCLIFFSAGARRKRALDELREMNRST